MLANTTKSHVMIGAKLMYMKGSRQKEKEKIGLRYSKISLLLERKLFSIIHNKFIFHCHIIVETNNSRATET